MTHNVHGPHDDAFYKYLAGLESEYEDLRRSGYAGEGFHSRGIRLGAGTSHNLPPHLARLKALEAAEKRKRAGDAGGRLLGGGNGGILGGGRKQLTPRELALRVSFVLTPFWVHPFSPPQRCVEVPIGLTDDTRPLPLFTAGSRWFFFSRLLNGGNTTIPPVRLEPTLKGKPRKPQRRASKTKPST